MAKYNDGLTSATSESELSSSLSIAVPGSGPRFPARRIFWRAPAALSHVFSILRPGGGGQRRDRLGPYEPWLVPLKAVLGDALTRYRE